MSCDHRLTLRAFDDADEALFCRWLGEAHVRRWYEPPSAWIAEIEKRHAEYSWIHHFIAESSDVPIGFGQFYEYRRGGETWHGDADTVGAYSIDYLIGPPECIGKGLGTELIKALIGKVALQRDARCIIAQPEPDNQASRAALASAGFRYDEKNRLFRYTLS